MPPFTWSPTLIWRVAEAGEKDIDARAKFDEAHTLATAYAIANFLVKHNAAG